MSDLDLKGTVRRYDLGKWLVENGYSEDDILSNSDLYNPDVSAGLTHDYLSKKRPDLGYKHRLTHFRVDSAGTDGGVGETFIWHDRQGNREVGHIPNSSPVGFFADVFGCAGAHGVLVAEFGNVTDDPTKVVCGICRQIMRPAIREYKKTLAKQEKELAKQKKAQAEEDAKKPKFTKIELKQKMLWYKDLYKEGERNPKLIRSIKTVKKMLDTRHYIRYDGRDINPNWMKRGWTKAYLEGKLTEYAKTYIDGERDPKLIESIERVTYALSAGQYKR
tara:strand:- start:869 stop:1696 length:828 start_codon:yes stop_codon:yes gene_type:complete